MAIIAGFLGFFGGQLFFSKQGVPVCAGIALMILGQLLLIASCYLTGRDLSGNFISVEAKCVDWEVKEYEDPDSIGSMIRNTCSAPIIICEFHYMEKTIQYHP